MNTFSSTCSFTYLTFSLFKFLLFTYILIVARTNLILEYKRFKQLEPVCSNLAVIYDAFIFARNEKV